MIDSALGCGRAEGHAGRRDVVGSILLCSECHCGD
eukprot:XP_001705125.1 Hypothetical protein GL50803_34641 [Giardia lamblia ATCC 50803]